MMRVRSVRAELEPPRRRKSARACYRGASAAARSSCACRLTESMQRPTSTMRARSVRAELARRRRRVAGSDPRLRGGRVDAWFSRARIGQSRN
jgi:hypothetical protein